MTLERSVLVALVFVLAGVAPALGQNPTPKRHALLIGNSNYANVLALAPARPNVARLESALRSVNFETVAYTDATLNDLNDTIWPQFLDSLQAGDICLIYYSGYAAAYRRENYLVPIDFNPQQPLDSAAKSITDWQQQLDDKKVALKIIVIEAGGGGQWTLTNPNTDTTETVFAFSTALGQPIAQLKKKDVGLFTASVAEAIDQPGTRLQDVFLNVQTLVALKSEKKQQPYFLPLGVTTPFFFRDAAPPEKIIVVKEKERDPNAPEIGVPRSNRIDREGYIWIPAGKFLMGCVPGTHKCEEGEGPQHPVEITKAFWMGWNEVQTDSYQRYVAADKKNRKMPKSVPNWNKKWQRGDLPMAYVNWEDAKNYCIWAGGRLPTEAEWEYAARAGKDNEILPLNDENSRDMANFAGKSGNDIYDDEAAPVRKFNANVFGLYDMAGNVWEWVNDWFSKSYYANSELRDPQGPKDGKEHVSRGGSYASDPKLHLRMSFRRPTKEGGNNTGFRCVLEDTPKTRELLTGR